MNERFEQLARQAANGMLSYDSEGDWSLNQHELEKFAQLIVKECAHTIQEYVDHRIPASEYPTRLKKYFE